MSMELIATAPMERYLESTPIVDWRTPSVQLLAQNRPQR